VTGVSIVTYCGEMTDPGARSSVTPSGLSKQAARVARLQPEVTALALIVLWLGLEIAWRWRRMKAWIG
jgi:hypothetical protein